MIRKIITGLIALGLSAALMLTACSSLTTLAPTPTATPVTTPPLGATATPTPAAGKTACAQAEVSRVIDGDTIEVSINGYLYTVRYIGIDTPETVHPSKPVECFGVEASNKNKALVEGKTVCLEKDVSETDMYGRLLRYVWVGDMMVNAELVRLGYAQVSTYPPDVKYQDYFLQLQRQARDAGLGLWGQCASGNGSPSPTSSGNCDPCYAGVCIPPYPPDLDCKDIPYRNFTVTCDPHGFDSDHDGIGCED
jgi:micrococcal nuclease